MTPSQKKSNVRLGLVLASVALVFFCGVVFKMMVLGS
ncbi:MAG: cytochrome oxidase small assembly protein [Rhodoferax sp.]|nr:cytochrome oxidase small assembly protein [Rhodoferax sp.]